MEMPSPSFHFLDLPKFLSTKSPASQDMNLPKTPPVPKDVPSPPSSPRNASLLERMPMGAWDSHMHVFGDIEQYPILEDARYIPSPHPVLQAFAFEQTIGVQSMVLVQPSVYGYDNSCLLDALRILGPDRARGVVALNPKTISSSTLREWHNLGVRGVRLNLKSVERSLSDVDFCQQLQAYADAIRPLGWILQLYVPMSMLPLLESIAGELNVTLCLDHFGSPALSSWRGSGKKADPRLLEGWSSLLHLISAGHTYVKISAPYRLGTDMEDEDMLTAIVKELSRDPVCRNRLIWASDWPHTRFEGLDIIPFIETVLGWCNADEEFRNSLFRDTALKLWH